MQNGYVLTFPGTSAGFTGAFADLRRALDALSLQQRARYNCELVFEEVVTNIIKHAFTDDRAHDVEVSVHVSGEAIVMSFEDDGTPFDPLTHQPVKHSGSLLDATIGGRGLVLLRTASRRLAYERTPNQRNRLTVTIDANG
jgi:anti-sigma regulatory factor (Ser/Thr protein kinase)